MNKPVLLLILAPFSALSLAALWAHGYWGLFEPAFHSLASAQVLADLVIALTLFLVWMWRDASINGRNPWPWLVLTVAVGSFGPLLYLLTARHGRQVN
jgi:Terpene cyclase DEP1